MAEKKSLLLRLNPDLWLQLQRLADADMRSVNAEIEYLLREAVRRRTGTPKEEIREDDLQ